MSTLEAYVGYKEKLAKKSVGRLGELIIGEKAVDPTNMMLRQGLLGPWSAVFGARGSRLAEAGGGLAGQMVAGPAGGILGSAIVGKAIADRQRKKLVHRLLAGGAVLGGGGAAAAYANRKK